MNFLENLIDVKIQKNMGIYNMTDEFFCLYLNQISRTEHSNILVVVDSLFEANKIYHSLCIYHPSVFLFPMDDFLTSEALAVSPDLRISRLETIQNILHTEGNIVITNLMGYLRFLPNKKTYEDSILTLSVGDTISPSVLAEKLSSIGYHRDTIVNQTGEFAVRGFIIDVFPLDEENPIRIEFFDDEIESIRYFQSDTQKSISSCSSILISPFTEFLTTKSVASEIFGKQKYLREYENVQNISDYLGNCYTFFKDYNQLEVSYTHILDDITTYRSEKDSSFQSDYMFDFYSLKPSFAAYYFSFNNYMHYPFLSSVVDFSVKTINPFHDDSSAVSDFILEKKRENKTILICLKKSQLHSVMKHLSMKLVESSLESISLGEVNLVEKEFNQGFIYQDFVVLTANELFQIKEKKKNYQTKFKYGVAIQDFKKLNVGDYVVHNIHGIGIYNGIKSLTLNNITKDYLEVLYQGTDKIYIPVEKIDHLTKFSGNEGVHPKVNSLSGTDWERTKARVRSRVSDIAMQLLKLYAEREARHGFAFSKDCEMSLDFEKDFPYDLTTDQKLAIEQIKKDMESPVPMDRLLCGDVGFGKTEVAFVAAFKAILDSKQVLFLCPTTILSNQHYENALVRFQNFPVNIGLLNRFTTPKEVSRILDGLKDGTIDMVIGTHRLLSDDVYAKNLGLLIIDEEQRFGVVHKEKIKQYKSNVDVLTLTATPIPRTLQMSLVGIRSLSLIETPPINRYPVQTYVVEENKQILREAIYKELSRGGQVFILYNRVQSIQEFAARIQFLAPDARIGIAHGQMNKSELENTIYDFIKNEFDILVCTTIIETGIDIPNVNTLIVMDADHFGLSQLYQIRGRVGRSDKFAYAYLMYQPFKSLTEAAIKRLNVIKEFTELGSGFSIATRDLSIRGAGDILGSEQAGFIDTVGIDLYLKMLEEEVNRQKGQVSFEEESLEESAPLIDVTTHIEDQYVLEDDLKIEIHRLINSICDMNSFLRVKEELEDRFGKVNEDILVYMYEEWFENLSNKLHIKQVRQTRNSIEFSFPSDVVQKLDMEEVFMDAFHVSPMFRFIGKGEKLIIVLDIIKLEKHPIFYLVELCNKIYEKFGKVLD